MCEKILCKKKKKKAYNAGHNVFTAGKFAAAVNVVFQDAGVDVRCFASTNYYI